MKTILITGSTDGIGKLAAIKFAKEGHSVYVHGRDSDKLSVTISEIKAISKNEKIKGFIADFSELESVKEMISQIKKEITRLDILINNAGIFQSPVTLAKNGVDIRLAVNYFAPYLLTQSLIPLIKKGTSSRIINLSSAAQSSVSFEALKGKEQLSVQEAYAQSKLALTMWSFHLAKEHQNIGIIAVNPGSLLHTKMAIEAYGQHWSPADKGADIIYELAVSEEYNGVTGKYFDNDKGTEKGFFAPAHPETTNQQKINELIEITESLL